MLRRSFILGAGGALLTAGLGAAAWRNSTGSLATYKAYSDQIRADLRPSEAGDLIRYATLAANSHNTQPWRFRIGADAIDVQPDFSRRTSAVDPDDHHLFISLGCACENLAIAAATTGRPGEIVIAPDTGAARYLFVNGRHKSDPLLAAIVKRQSTRAQYDGRPIPNSDLVSLSQAAAVPGVHLTLLTDRPMISKVRDLVIAGNDAEMNDPAFVSELKQWLRF